MIAIDRRHIRVRLTLWFMAVLAAALVLYSAAACFFLLRDLRAQLVRHAIQDVETVEGLLVFTPEGRLILRDDYHNHPESKRVLERLVEVRSPDGGVLFRNEMLGSRSLGERSTAARRRGWVLGARIRAGRWPACGTSEPAA